MAERLRTFPALMLMLTLSLVACEASDNGSVNTDDPVAPNSRAQTDQPSASMPLSRREPAPALAEAESETGSYSFAVTEASRSDGVLTIKARVTLLQGQSGSHTLLSGADAKELYLVAGDQKYMILKDNEGEPLTTDGGYYPRFRSQGDSNAWWAKFPAPPPEVKTVGLYFKHFLPVENIPIADR